MLLFNLLADETGGGQDYTMLIVLGVIVIAFIVMSFINNKNRKKQMAEEQQKKDSLCKGTKVITIGGIVGTVVSVDHANNTFVLETEKSKIKFDKRAIYQMDLPENAKVEAKEEKVEEVKEEKVEETKAE
ncbi:MAG: preprotein translocase subunit YajC [Clostridia bacterium]|nr:preprotein translocase subunit YajC [Clostridia bacterium]